jgi:nucleoside-diphosphate-sugar epimerase
MFKFLVTGSSGSIGSDLLKFLSLAGYGIESVSRSERNLYSVPASIEPGTHLCLLHFGSATPANSSNEDLGFETNTTQLIYLIEDLQKIKCKVDVIFASSMSVYDYSLAEESITELTVKTSTCSYGLSKLACEDFLQSYYERSLISGYCTLRLPGVLARNSDINSKNFLSLCIQSIMANESVTLFNRHGLFNNVVSSYSISQLIKELVSQPSLPNAAVNLASWPPISLDSVIAHIKYLANSESSIEWVHSPKPSFTISVEAARAIGFRPASVLETIETHFQLSFNK